MPDVPEREPKTEVLVTNLGTPAAPTEDAVRSFLAEFLSDPLVVSWPRVLWKPVLHGIVLRRRPRVVAEAYRAIWTEGGSPLKVMTESIAAALGERLGESAIVTPAFRYGAPSLVEILERAMTRAARVDVLPLFPQRTASTTGTLEALLGKAARVLELDPPPRLLLLAPDDPGYVEALATRAEEAGVGEVDRLLVSFHGIPASVDRREGGRYSRDCERTTVALAERLGRDESDVTLCYQSRFGPGRWLEPATADLLSRLPREGTRLIAVIAPGFLTDGLETLEELGERGRRAFLDAGGRDFRLVSAVGDHPALIETLVAILSPAGRKPAL